VAKVGGYSEEAIRDAWARWTEQRPPALDWSTNIEMRAAGSIDPTPPWEPAATRELKAARVQAARHVARVQLEAPKWAATVGDLPTREVICEWEVEASRALAVLNTLTAAFEDEVLMRACHERVPGWQSALEAWVWDHLVLHL
jgi:hypothetical protein